MFGGLLLLTVSISDLFLAPIFGQQCLPAESTSILNTIFIENSDLSLQPIFPIVVNISAEIFKLKHVDEKHRVAELKIELVQSWRDPRLIYPGCDDTPTASLSIPADQVARIWSPSIDIIGGFKSSVIKSPGEMSELLLNPTEGLLWQRKEMITFVPCESNFIKFPFDRIACKIELGTLASVSYVHLLAPSSEALLKINEDHHPLFHVERIECPKVAVNNIYACRMWLERYSTFYILHTYIPCCLLVLLSYSSFYFPVDNIRVPLTLTCLVTMVMQFSAVSAKIPAVGYTIGIDVWMVFCIVYIIGVHSVYVGHAYLQRLASDKNNWRVSVCCRHMKQNELSLLIDRVARVTFLLVFLVFVVVYFIIFV